MGERVADRFRRLRGRWAVLALLPSAGRPALAAYGVTWLIGIVSPLGFPIATGLLIGAVTRAAGKGTSSPETGDVLSALAITAAIFLGQRLFEPIQSVAREVAVRRIDAAAQERLMLAAMAPVGVAHLDDPKVLDDIKHATLPLGPVVIAVPQLAARYASAAAACVIVATASVWLALLVFAIVIVQRQFWRAWGLRMQAMNIEMQEPTRRSDYFSSLLLTPMAAKEARIFGLPRWIMSRQEAAWREIADRLFAWYDGMLRQFAWALPVRCVGFVVPYTFLAYAAAHGNLSLATFAAALQATATAINQAAFTAEDVQLEHMLIAYPALLRLEAIGASERSAAVPGQRPASRETLAPLSTSIDIRGLTFSYPGTERSVYDGFDLSIRSGESLAIVGANGAGKTTLVKLLARLYEPDAGTIEVDGVDLSRIDLASWRRQVAAIFQDFTCYPLTVADNIGFGAPDTRSDAAALERAAASAGALPLIEALPAKWDTVLSRSFSGGVDLSGGEWQRIALARAMFAVEGGARVLVLDEPTAKLDVRAEAELFDRFLEITHGMTTILISHRFSTVRRADRICVVEDGRVVEDGSHAELLEVGGLYAQMFQLQAARFIDGDTPPSPRADEVASA